MTHVSVDEHAVRVAALLGPALEVGAERVPLLSALGRVLANDVLAPVDLPLFTNSQMDGYAVRSADVANAPVTLPIAGVIPAAAGEPPALAPGAAVRIMTGAPVPKGADAVIPIEDTTVDGGSVTITRARSAGEYVRERGSDVRSGALLVERGRMLSSRHLAALAAAGIGNVDVRQVLRVAVITTGSELVPPGEEALPGQVYDANAVALIAAVRMCGARVALSRRVVDDPAQLLAALDEAASAADLILTSGGISKGDFEVVRELLEPRGATVVHLAMQPGGPQATAVFEGVPVICFPGNPVSTQISFEVFVAPHLRRTAGLAPERRETRTLSSGVHSIAGRRQFLRGTLVGDAHVEVSSGPGSHLVAGLAASDALIVVPEDVTGLEPGDPVEVWHL
ncbi:MAG: molybdopterin biosynthesis protein [Rhodoglobus sp.]|nr:molybdopterin biosynthesis protein [Rhodoglobus sp.]